MRGWGWIGGALVVLVGATLTAGLVGAPRGTTAEERPTEAARAAARVRPTASASRVAGAALAHDHEPRAVRASGADDPLADGVAFEIERQRSAMRAALLLLVAGDASQTRIR